MKAVTAANAAICDDSHFSMDKITSSIKDELDNSKIDTFCKSIDGVYHNHIRFHYIGFNRLRDGFLTQLECDQMYMEMESTFPILCKIIHTTVMSRRNLFQDNEEKQTVAKKRNTILNYVLALFHLLDIRRLKHWALIGTPALHLIWEGCWCKCAS